jgi:hypothetical protein
VDSAPEALVKPQGWGSIIKALPLGAVGADAEDDTVEINNLGVRKTVFGWVLPILEGKMAGLFQKN